MPSETEAQYQARLRAWSDKKAAGDWFPGPMPRRGDQMPIGQGMQSEMLGPTAPGASLNTAQADADRLRLGSYLEQLQGQAQTGAGAWEQVLAQNTNATKSGAMALGQSQEGVDPMTAARNIGNAQAGADQRAVGQGNLLRAQTRQQATGQLSDILSGQQGLDASQATTGYAAQQGQRQANELLRQQAKQEQLDQIGATGQGVTAGAYSEGGEVPGKPKVFGDTEINDVVPAKLSPLEIVLPLSVTMAPNAPEAAARFVAAVKARGTSSGPNFDDGGQVGPSAGIGDSLRAGRALMPSPFSQVASKADQPIASGDYNQTRDASLANQARLGEAAAGRGPSVAPQAFQNSVDSVLGGAMRADANGHRPNADLVGMAAEQQQGAAGNAAGLAAGEQQRAGASFADAVNRQRAQDLSFAQAQQQAAWRNTMLDAGLGLQQQAQLQGLLGAAGQGAVALSGMFGAGPNKGYDSSDMSLSGGKIYDDELGKAHGGEIGFPEGSVVAHLARQGTRPQARRPNPNKRPTEASPALPTPTKAERAEERREGRQYDTENPDLKDLEVNFAEGGAVFPAEAQGAPQPGPFAPPQANRGTLLDLLARIAHHPDAPQPRGEDIALPPEQQAARLAAAPPPRTQSPAAPPMLHGAQARERPFLAKPQAPAPIAAPAPTQAAPVRPAAPPVDPMADQKKALGMKAEAETTQADTTAAALGGLQQKLEANAIAQNEAHARASEQAQQQLGAIQQAREELKNVDTTVDPDRFMARRGWAGKLSAIVGLVLGAVGNDNGVNRAAQLLNQQIDRDLDAQKSEHELALRKGQSAVDSAQTVYSLSRQMTQDDIAANLAARGTMLDLAKNQIDIAAAKAGAPLAKANLAMLSAQLDAEKRKADDALKQRGFDNHIKQMNAESDRLRALKEGNAPGVAAQSALLATVQTEETTIKQQGEKLKALIKKFGTGELTGPAEAEMRQAVDNMAVAAAKMKDPNSAARPSEVEIESRNIFQPGFFKQTGTALQQIDSYLANSEQRRQNAFSARGAAVPGATPQAAPAAAKKLMRLPSGEVVEVR